MLLLYWKVWSLCAVSALLLHSSDNFISSPPSQSAGRRQHNCELAGYEIWTEFKVCLEWDGFYLEIEILIHFNNWTGDGRRLTNSSTLTPDKSQLLRQI